MPLLEKLPSVAQSPLFPVVLAMVFQIIAGAVVLVRGASITTMVLGAIMIITDVIAGGLLAQWSVGVLVPGANDNATGAAAVLTLAELWHEEPVEVVFLLPS